MDSTDLTVEAINMSAHSHQGTSGKKEKGGRNFKCDFVDGLFSAYSFWFGVKGKKEQSETSGLLELTV